MMIYSNSKVGDRVAYCPYSLGYGRIRFHYTEVEKITATILTTTDERKFNLATGNEIKTKTIRYPAYQLWELTNADQYKAQTDEMNKAGEAIRDLEKALRGKKNGLGEYFIDAVQVRAINDLTAILLTKEITR